MEPKRVRTTEPSAKAIKALQLRMQGHKITHALREAGYSKAVVRKGNHFFRMPSVQKAVMNMAGMLQGVGVDQQKIATKIAEFIDASKIDHSQTEPDRVVPDYKTQIEGVKMAKEIIENQFGQGVNKKKREMTITEFVMGDENG